MKRKHYLQIIYCPPLTTDKELRDWMDKKADRMNRRPGHRRYASSINQAFGGKVSEELRALAKRTLEKMPPGSKWDFIIWVTDCKKA